MSGPALMSKKGAFILPLNNFQLKAVIFWISVILSRVTCQDENYPPMTFETDPIPGSVVSTGSKILICRSSSLPSPEYRWLKDGVNLTSFSGSGYSYRIANIQREDAGIYRCEARNPLGSILSAPADVRVAYMDPFEGEAAVFPITANVSNPIVIPLASIDSYPTPTLTWFENNQPMNKEGSRYHISLNSSLVLLDRGLQDTSKLYKIEALNGNTGTLENGPSYSVTISSAAGVVSSLPPHIVIAPVNKTVSEVIDVKAEFECIVNARPVDQVQIYWFRVENGTKTQINGSDKLDKYLLSSISNRTLTIKSPNPADSGLYRCEASLAGYTELVTASAYLAVHVSPTFRTNFPGPISRDFGQTLTIPCQASGIPTPTIHWYFNAEEITSNLISSYTIHDNGSLTISQLDLEHAGMYQCFLRNVAGETSKAVWLKVNSSPPVFLTRPTDITIVEGGDARFPCETKGAPLPVVSWKKVSTDGVTQNVTTNGRIQILDRGELLIVSVVASDSGVYTCNASNSKGFVTASATLSVRLKTQIVRPPQDQNVIKGNSVVFPCGVSHDPDITITWQWTHKTITSSQDQVIIPDSRRMISSEGTLTILGINNLDIGNYTCYVTSTGGNDSRTVSLTVIELPQPPVITSVSLHPTDVRGVIVHWSPGYNGNTPILEYSVQYNEVLYSTDTGDTSSQTWITYNDSIPATAREAPVSGLRPARFYLFRVFASNVVGEGMPSDPKPVPPLEMPQQPPSSPPKGFFGIPASNTSITLGWQPPNEDTWNGPLLGYTIQYKLAGYQTITSINVSNLAVNPRFELTGLAFYQEYELRIAAFNAEGVGVFSGYINVMTMEGHPIVAPENLRAVAVNSTTIKVSWIPPNQQFINGRNLGYKVLGKRVGVQSEFVTIVSQDPANPTGEQSTNLHNLLKYTNYSITVLCYTSQGDGPKASPVIVRTQEDVPSMVDSLTFNDIRDTSLTVLWTPPTEANGIITGYKLMYEKKDKTGTGNEFNLSASTHNKTITGLQPTTKYTINVYASTQVGQGPARSADIESGVPPELPQHPYNLGVSNIEAKSVLLQFLPGFDGKTSITLWIVEAQEGGENDPWKKIFEVSDPDARALQVGNLRPYTYYRLRIIAENIVGRSDPSLPSRLFQTLQDAPGAPPGNVTVRALNATALRVSWTPLSRNDWNGDPRGYKIYYRMKGETQDFLIMDLDNGMNMDSAILKNLEEWMEYEVKMVAYNEVGRSNYSPITVERTRESVPSVGPNSVTARSLSSTSINVTWQEVPIYEQNGMILGFKVKYRSDEAGIVAELQDVPGNTSTHVVIQNLRKYVTYEIRVLAYTRMGDGSPSSPEVSVKTMEDVPGPPGIVWFPQVSFTTATVVWEAPSEPNGIITGYLVSYKLDESQDEYVNSSVLSAGTRSYTTQDLQRQAYYEFRLRAKTRLGWGTAASVTVFTMNNRSPPDSPSQPTIKESMIFARSITISWIPAPFNGYGPLRNFTVQFKSRNNPWTTVQDTIMPEVHTYAVESLRPNTPYVFRVAATNDIGTSSYSVQSKERITLEDKPEGAPENVKVKPLTTNSVRVSWEQPPEYTWNGNLLNYTLLYRQTENENFMEESIPFGTNELTLTNLVKFVNYEFLMKASNSRGNGPASKPVIVYVGEAAPTAAPINIVARPINSTEIEVSWNPPPPETQNGDLSGYRIFYWISTQSPETANQIIEREQSTVIQGLEIYTQYGFTVQAYNLAGEGPMSEIIYSTTLEGLPGKPASISFWNITFTSIEVRWEPPLKPNGRIQNYSLSYLEESGGGMKLVKFNVNGSQTSLVIRDLLPMVTYKFSVSASTSQGQGDSVEMRVQTGPQTGSPGAPVRPILEVDPSGQKLTLIWRNGRPGTTPIYSHIIQSKTEDSSDWATVLQIFGNDTRAEISVLKLNPDNKYQFRVLALNSIGISNYSAPSEPFRTPSPAMEEPEVPFHYQWWFLVIVALIGLIIILAVVLLLCLVSRRNKTKQKKGATSTSTANLAPPAESEDGGFGNFELTRQSTNRRQKYAGIRNGSTNNIYARAPPRPSPASVAYSDDDTPSVVKPPLPDDDDDDDSQSSGTAKPSDLGDSTEPSDQESDEDSIDPPLPPPPPSTSPPPPPFTRNPYISDPVPLTNVNSWQNNPNSSFNAYQYTDSEAESSHYAYSLNGGQILMNNTAGSRAPLPGFSSFV